VRFTTHRFTVSTVFCLSQYLCCLYYMSPIKTPYKNNIFDLRTSKILPQRYHTATHCGRQSTCGSLVFFPPFSQSLLAFIFVVWRVCVVGLVVARLFDEAETWQCCCVAVCCSPCGCCSVLQSMCMLQSLCVLPCVAGDMLRCFLNPLPKPFA